MRLIHIREGFLDYARNDRGKLRLIGQSLSIIGFILFLGSQKVQANEGTVWMGGENREECYASTIMVEPNRYEIMMSCRGLEVPPESESLYYVAWARKGEEEKSAFGKEYTILGTLNTGKLSNTLRNSFEELLVTVEKTSRPSNPSEKIVMRGMIEELNFTFEGKGAEITDASVVQIKLTPTPQPEVKDIESEAEMGSVVARIGRFFLVTLGVVVVVAVVISTIQKRTAEK